MTTRYTKTDVRNAVSSLSSIAKTVGVLPDHVKLVYSPGNISNGISATIEAVAVQDNGHRNTVLVGFLPEFTYKTTMREQTKLVEAVTNALYAVSLNR